MEHVVQAFSYIWVILLILLTANVFFDDDYYFYSHYVSVRLCNENPGVDLASIYAVFAGPRTSPSSGGGGRAPFPTSGWLWSIMLIASFTIGVIFASDERRLSACSGLSKQYY